MYGEHETSCSKAAFVATAVNLSTQHETPCDISKEATADIRGEKGAQLISGLQTWKRYISLKRNVFSFCASCLFPWECTQWICGNWTGDWICMRFFCPELVTLAQRFLLEYSQENRVCKELSGWLWLTVLVWIKARFGKNMVKIKICDLLTIAFFWVSCGYLFIWCILLV